MKNNTSTNEHCSDVSDASHDVSLPSTIFSMAAKQAVCEGSPVCEANAPFPCSGDIASVLSQSPNEHLEYICSLFCSVQLLAVLFHSCLAMKKFTVSQSTK